MKCPICGNDGAYKVARIVGGHKQNRIHCEKCKGIKKPYQNHDKLYYAIRDAMEKDEENKTKRSKELNDLWDSIFSSR